MNNYLLTCRSLTYAQRAAKVLEKSKIRAVITKILPELSEFGCGYGVRIREEHKNTALNLLRKNGIEIRGVYGIYGADSGEWVKIG